MGHYDEQRDNHNNQTACAKYLFERFDYRVNMSALMEQLSITHSALDSALADFMEGRQANLQGLIKHAARMRCEASAALLVRQYGDGWLDALEVDSNGQYFSVDSVKEVFDAAGVSYK